MIIQRVDLYGPALPIFSVAWRLAVATFAVGEGAILGLTLLADPMAIATVGGRIVGGTVLVVILTLIALAIGLPLYLIYRHLRLTSPWAFALGAGLIALALYALPDALPQNGSVSMSMDGRDVFVAGQRTGYGWFLFMQDAALYAAFGAIAGLIFWGLLCWRPRAMRTTTQTS